MDDTCTALNLSDRSKCQEKATAANGLFCIFHARQCQAMYLGYKKRNARLDEAEATKPEYLVTSKTNIGNDTFKSVADEKVLNELFSFLFHKRNLLERVIKARKLHHSHFYSMELDYGHQAYIDKSMDEKIKVTSALERLQRCTADVLFQKQQWFHWVRQQQDDEEAAKEKESKKIRKEAQLLKRHWKEVEGRLKMKRKQEDEKRQDAYLEAAYQERQALAAEMGIDGVDDLDEWDPIEDAVEDDRNDYVDLMRSLLWLVSEQETDLEKDDVGKAANSQDKTTETNGDNQTPNGDGAVDANDGETAQDKQARKKARAKARAQAKAAEKKEQDSKSSDETPEFDLYESKADMRHRLLEGEEYGDAYRSGGLHGIGSFENPPELDGKVPGMNEEEVEEMLKEVAEVKELLFCRVVLSYASVLPAALRAGSIQELLADPELSTTDLRDIWFRLEQPTLQEVRDACADLAQHENPGEVAIKRDDQTALELVRRKLMLCRYVPRSTKIPHSWRSQHELNVEQLAASRRQIKEDNASQTITDFGELDGQGEFHSKKVKVRICGKTIWNYPSEGTMTRGGWLTFSILTKGSRLEDAVSLCRNWQEFWELNCLAMYRYFPSGRWTSWVGDQFQCQLLKLGLIPYFYHDGAERDTVSHQVGSSRGQIRRAHDQYQAKNVICACINRNDPVSRRFVKYLTMEAGSICLLVRDAKTGRILLKPPKEHLWLSREKSGVGRAVKNNAWRVRAEVNEKMFEKLESTNHRRWHFGFNEYYDLTVWDLEPGKHVSNLFNTIQYALIKANRMRSMNEMHRLVEPVLKTLYRDNETGKVRDAKDGEHTMYDELHSDKYYPGHTKGKEFSADDFDYTEGDFCYNDTDAAEDAILFPDELSNNPLTAILDIDDPIWGKLTDLGPNMARFIEDADTSDDSDGLANPDKLIELENRLLEEFDNSAGDNQSDDSSLEDLDSADEEDWSTEGSEEAMQRLHYREDDTVSLKIVDLERSFEDKALAKRVWDFIENTPREMTPKADFDIFVEREKAKAYTPAFRASDFNETAEKNWHEIHKLTVEARRLRKKDRSVGARTLEMLMWLDTHPYKHRMVERDMQNVSASICLFFPNTTGPNSELDRWLLTLPGATKLFDNDFKAQAQPYQRTTCSNHTVTPNFIEQAREETKAKSRAGPAGWDLKERLMIAKLYKTGIIEPGPIADPAGQVLLGKEAGREENMYIDYCFADKRFFTPQSAARDYRTIDLLKTAHQWSQKHMNARFALFRIWTHSHFYPLTAAPEKRDPYSFRDSRSRIWHFRFLPKDSWYAEWPMHHMVEERLRPWKRMLGARYDVKRDIVLVKGEDEKDLQRYATAVAFGLQTQPWRFEVDLWKSFVNVDFEFLQGLDGAWLE